MLILILINNNNNEIKLKVIQCVFDTEIIEFIIIYNKII